jgi:hypothetical protein
VLKGEYSSCITLSNMGFYRLRVLKQLHEDKEDNP